jgi:hypothetical protein
MPETSQIVFSFKEVVTALVKEHDIHEGIWGLFVRFGLQASNIGETERDVRPAAIIPVVEIGLQKFEKENNISVDASKVNPRLEQKRVVVRHQ